MLKPRFSTAALAICALSAVVAADDPPKPEVPRAFRPVVRPLVPKVGTTARTDSGGT